MSKTKDYMVALLLILSMWAVCCTPTTDSLNVQTRTLYFSHKTPVEMQQCLAYVVNSNYRRVEMLINTRHIDRVVVTDAEIDECDSDNFVGCPEDSTFCLSAKNVVGSLRFTVGKCISRFFVYLYMEDFEESDITAKILGDKGCDNIAETDYTTCASVPLDECGLEDTAEAENECNRNCFRLECTYLDALKKNRTSFEACLPSFLQSERFNELCSSENNYFNVQSKSPLAHYCGGKNSRRIPRSLEQAKSLSFWEIIVVLLVIAVGIFALSVVWYRIMLARTGSPPFTPPHWMPAFLYPRPVRTLIVEEPQQELTNYTQI